MAKHNKDASRKDVKIVLKDLKSMIKLRDILKEKPKSIQVDGIYMNPFTHSLIPVNYSMSWESDYKAISDIMDNKVVKVAEFEGCEEYIDTTKTREDYKIKIYDIVMFNAGGKIAFQVRK